MSAVLIDGKAIAAALRGDLKKRVALLAERGVQPRLDVIIVGDNPASLIYVQNKQRACDEVGIQSFVHRFPGDAAEKDIRALIDKLNDDNTHGILLQLPLPPPLQAAPLLNAVHYSRDVDGLNLINVGRRSLGLHGLLPCTPKGCITLIKTIQKDLKGLHALVVGRSDLVGKPMAQLLLRENCTVTQAHIYTTNLPELCRQADILVVAIGQPKFIQGNWIKPGAIVIDVGINRVDDKITGDVDFEAAKEKAAAITPVPGGVGPMTIACLLENTLEVAESA